MITIPLPNPRGDETYHLYINEEKRTGILFTSRNGYKHIFRKRQDMMGYIAIQKYVFKQVNSYIEKFNLSYVEVQMLITNWDYESNQMSRGKSYTWKCDYIKLLSLLSNGSELIKEVNFDKKLLGGEQIAFSQVIGTKIDTKQKLLVV